MNYNISDRLVVELITGEIYEGDYVSGSDNRIEIKNIYENSTRNNLGDQILTFYKSEISTVRLLIPAIKETQETSTTNEVINNDKNVIKLNETDYNQLKQLTKDYKYLTCIDANYYTAVDDLYNCENVGIAGMNHKPGRASKLDLLVIASWAQVYIFDLLLFNKTSFPKELKDILTSKCVMKIVHDGRSLTDCLYHCYDFKMENIFDTQVADVMVEKQETGNKPEKVRNLGECFQVHFNFPDHIFKPALNINSSRWHKRPLSEGSKHSASLLAAYLITLKNHLQQLLLKDFYSNVSVYGKSTLKKSAVEANTLLNMTGVDDLMSDLKLDTQ